MATKAQVTKRAKALGVTLEELAFEGVWDVEIATVGRNMFASTCTHTAVTHQHALGPKADFWDYVLDDMADGVVACDIENCTSCDES